MGISTITRISNEKGDLLKVIAALEVIYSDVRVIPANAYGSGELAYIIINEKNSICYFKENNEDHFSLSMHANEENYDLLKVITSSFEGQVLKSDYDYNEETSIWEFIPKANNSVSYSSERELFHRMLKDSFNFNEIEKMYKNKELIKLLVARVEI